MSEETRKTNPTDPDKVKPGDLMAIIHYVKVAKVGAGGGMMTVTPADKPGQNIDVIGRDLIGRALSADYFAEEVKVTATVMEELLTGEIFNRPISVLFVKENGEDRVLRGRYLKKAPFGRSFMEDMDLPIDNRVRLVDHRTVKWLIVDGVKYTVKGKK